MTKKGRLIVIEGGEGSGKGGHVKSLIQFLEEKEVPRATYREPGEGIFGEELRKIIKHSNEKGIDATTEVFLFEAARSHLYATKIIPALKEGTNVVTDRSGISTFAYQGHAGGEHLERIRFMNNVATRATQPDIAFIIDVEPQLGLSKEVVSDNRFTAKGPEYHEKVREGYLAYAKANPDNCILVPYQEGNFQAMQNDMQKELIRKFGKEWNIN